MAVAAIHESGVGRQVQYGIDEAIAVDIRGGSHEFQMRTLIDYLRSYWIKPGCVILRVCYLAENAKN